MKFSKEELRMIKYLANKQVDLVAEAARDMEEDIPKDNILAYQAKYEALAKKVRE